jgi:hypothetical protein
MPIIRMLVRGGKKVPGADLVTAAKPKGLGDRLGA